MTTAIMHLPRRTSVKPCTDSPEHRRCVERQARALAEQHHCFRGRAGNFDFSWHGGVLTVRGSVPSFYLKQVLQTVLRRLDGVARIDNQVDVVCSTGLSSIRDG